MKKNIFLFLITLGFVLTLPKYSFAKTKTFTPAKWAKACQAKGGECVNKEFLDKDKNLKQIAGVKCDSKGLTVCVNKNVNGKYFCSRCSNTKGYQRASFYTDKQSCDDSTDPTNYQDSSQNKYIIDCECPEVKGGDNSAKSKCSNNSNTGTGKTNPNTGAGRTNPNIRAGVTNPRTQQAANPFQQMTNSSRPTTQQNPLTQNPNINSGLTNPVNVGATTVPTGFQIPAALQNLIRGILPSIQNPVVRGLLSGLIGGQNGVYPMTSINGTSVMVQDGQGANVILNLRIRFFSNANTNANYKTIPVRVVISGGGMSSPVGQVVNFTNAGNNLWTGRASFQTNPNTNYSIYIKGPKHLQVKICDSSPRDNVNNNDILGIYKCGNVGQVLLRQGENNYDFTGIYMLPGDINQDGVLNNMDYGLLDSCFNWNIGADPNGQCAQADLNFDGAINLMDKGLLDYVFTKNFKTSDDNF